MNQSLLRVKCLLFLLLMSFGMTAHAQILDRIFLETSVTNRLAVESWSWELNTSVSLVPPYSLQAEPGSLVINRKSNSQSILLMHAYNERTAIPRVELTRGIIRMTLTNAVIVGFEVRTFINPAGKIFTSETISFQGQQTSFAVNAREVCVDAEEKRGCPGVLN